MSQESKVILFPIWNLSMNILLWIKILLIKRRMENSGKVRLLKHCLLASPEQYLNFFCFKRLKLLIVCAKNPYTLFFHSYGFVFFFPYISINAVNIYIYMYLYIYSYIYIRKTMLNYINLLLRRGLQVFTTESLCVEYIGIYYIYIYRYIVYIRCDILCANSFSIHMDNIGWTLTHWGRVTHICVIKQTIIGSDNGLSPGRRQAIIWTNDGILLIGALGAKFNEILVGIHTFSFKEMHLKMSSGKWWPFCLGLNGLTSTIILRIYIAICIIHWQHCQLQYPSLMSLLRDTRHSAYRMCLALTNTNVWCNECRQL